MPTYYDAARSQSEQDNYDPDQLPSDACSDCEKKLQNCRCPDSTPVMVPTVCEDCGLVYQEEYFGNYDETPHRCGTCWGKRRGESGEILF